MPLMLRQFKLLRPIASGGMGTVYRALDTSLNREVAVKLMKDELQTDSEAVESFQIEARACALPSFLPPSLLQFFQAAGSAVVVVPPDYRLPSKGFQGDGSKGEAGSY